MDKILADSDHPITLASATLAPPETHSRSPFHGATRADTKTASYLSSPARKKPKAANRATSSTSTSATTKTPTTKPKTPCPTCGKSFIRLKMHQRVQEKNNNALTETHYSTLPDFNNNYEHVTTRKTHTAQ